MKTHVSGKAHISKNGKSLTIESTREPTVTNITDMIAGKIDMEKIRESLEAKNGKGKKTLDEQLRFIELRARGLSFTKIAEKLNISKPTLLKWQVEFSSEINRFEFFALEAMMEEYKLRKEHRIRDLAITLQKAQKELENCDFSSLSTTDLLKVIDRLEEKLQKELRATSCETGETRNILEQDHFTEDIRLYLR